METLILSCGSAASLTPRSRLAAERGRADAVLLRTAFLVDVADSCRRWLAARTVGDANRHLVFAVDDSGDDPVVVDLAWRAGARIERAAGTSTAERLRATVDVEFARGARAVALVGAATPTLPTHLIEHAFRALEWERCVLGPSFDGGLWLVGLMRGASVVLPEGDWSTAQTAALLGLRLQEPPHLLPFWPDVGDAAAMERLVWHLRLMRATDPHAAPATWRALVRAGIVHEDVDSAATTLAMDAATRNR